MDTGDYVVQRAREINLETGKSLLESISVVLTVCEIHGTDWLSDNDVIFPFFD
jgi:hypothetical protein